MLLYYIWSLPHLKFSTYLSKIVDSIKKKYEKYKNKLNKMVTENHLLHNKRFCMFSCVCFVLIGVTYLGLCSFFLLCSLSNYYLWLLSVVFFPIILGIVLAPTELGKLALGLVRFQIFLP